MAVILVKLLHFLMSLTFVTNSNLSMGMDGMGCIEGMGCMEGMDRKLVK